MVYRYLMNNSCCNIMFSWLFFTSTSSGVPGSITARLLIIFLVSNRLIIIMSSPQREPYFSRISSQQISTRSTQSVKGKSLLEKVDFLISWLFPTTSTATTTAILIYTQPINQCTNVTTLPDCSLHQNVYP